MEKICRLPSRCFWIRRSCAWCRIFIRYHYWINHKSITGKYDSGYHGKVRLLWERRLAISGAKGVYDFTAQIRNDFRSWRCWP
ncbi:MAG: hypothetical protein V8Q27_03650 [Eubacteriales bacterium]